MVRLPPASIFRERATMLLMNHAYEFDDKDEDFIAQWLNDISFDLHPFPD